MTGRTISATYSTGVALTNSGDSPVTITSTASIASPTGVALSAAGGTYWTITSAGRIDGYTAGAAVAGSGTLVNAGQIMATQTGGAPGYTYSTVTHGFTPTSGGVLMGGGGVSNAAAGVIDGYWEGVALLGAGNVVNAGTIFATTTNTLSGFGIVLAEGGSASNAASGTINANRFGILTFGTFSTVTNLGHIASQVAIGVDVVAGGVVENDGGTIAGASLGLIVQQSTASSIVNQASIVGTTRAGVGLYGGGSLSNASSGVIIGGKYGAVFAGQVTIRNAGVMNGVTSIGAVLLGYGDYAGNAASGVMTGGFDGIYSRYAPTISNSGSIGGETRAGAALFGGGVLSNLGTGVITGGEYGIESHGTTGSATVFNADGGSVTGKYYGVRITNADATVDNLGYVASAAAYVHGDGRSFDAAGVDVADGGIVSNGTSGVIKATWKGVEVGYITAQVGGTVLNQGFIYASNSNGSTGAAVWIHGPGLISNAASGTIAGGPYAIVAYYQTTVANYGAIDGTEFSVDLTPGYTNRVIAGPGATFFGEVTGGNAIGSTFVSTLEFVSGAAVGTIDGLGSQFVDFGQIDVDSGATWTFQGSNSIAAGVTLNDAGTLLLGNAVLTDNGSMTIAGTGGINAYATVTGVGAVWNGSGALDVGYRGFGELAILNGATVISGNLEIDELGLLDQSGGSDQAATLTVAAGGRAGGSGADTFATDVFNSGRLFADGTLTVTTPLMTLQTAGQDGVLEIQHDGDLVLNVGSVDATQAVVFDDGTGVLTIGTLGGFGATIGNFIAGDEVILPGVPIVSTSFSASTHVLTLFGPSNAEAGILQFGSLVTDGSDISVNGVMPCFVSGTRIATERGDVAVEDLRIGDLVRVAGGGVQPVVWIGRRSLNCARHPVPEKVWPVRVAAHAFGAGRPARDLWLSPDHAVFLDNVLIPVKYLLDGDAIAQVLRRRVTYHHIELPRHDVLLAEGLPVESYLDTGDRSLFANGGDPVTLYPDFSSRTRDAVGCAPLLVTGAALEAVRRRVRAMAGMGRRKGTSRRR